MQLKLSQYGHINIKGNENIGTVLRQPYMEAFSDPASKGTGKVLIIMRALLCFTVKTGLLSLIIMWFDGTTVTHYNEPTCSCAFSSHSACRSLPRQGCTQGQAPSGPHGCLRSRRQPVTTCPKPHQRHQGRHLGAFFACKHP